MANVCSAASGGTIDCKSLTQKKVPIATKAFQIKVGHYTVKVPAQKPTLCPQASAKKQCVTVKGCNNPGLCGKDENGNLIPIKVENDIIIIPPGMWYDKEKGCSEYDLVLSVRDVDQLTTEEFIVNVTICGKESYEKIIEKGPYCG